MSNSPFKSGIIGSHSVWSAWIEITSNLKLLDDAVSRTLYGVRGLKSMLLNMSLIYWRRTLYGVRGLKYLSFAGHLVTLESHSVWSAWIEISACDLVTSEGYVAFCMECVD